MALEWRKDKDTCTYTSTNDEYIIHKETKNRFHLHRQGVIEAPLTSGTVKLCKGFAEDIASGRIKLSRDAEPKVGQCGGCGEDAPLHEVPYVDDTSVGVLLICVKCEEANENPPAEVPEPESPPVLPLQGDLIEVQQEQYKGLFGPCTTRLEDWLPPGKYEVIDNHVLIQTHEDGRCAWGVLLGRLRPVLGPTVQRWYIIDPYYLCLLDVNCQIAISNADYWQMVKKENQPTKAFTVVEYHTGFALRHNPTGHESWLGDGVDAFLSNNGDALHPGTPDFLETWQGIFDEIGEDELLDVYFPYMKENPNTCRT